MNQTRILIAGCSSGIGEELFKLYKEEGKYNVQGLSRTKGIICNCIDSVRVASVMEDIQPDVLINCVGQASMNLAMLTRDSQYDRVVTNNVQSTFLLNKEAARYMLRKRWGRIVNFGSCVTAMDIVGEALYTASKQGVLGFSRVFAHEVAAYGITVNTVSPGPVATRLMHNISDDKIQKVLAAQIIKRMPSFAEIKHVIDFLISRDSGMVTGQNIYINGAG
jgi:3-oxoacyl-[acyl-carrier protein] reductase